MTELVQEQSGRMLLLTALEQALVGHPLSPAF